MKKLKEKDLIEIQKLHSIYSQETPTFIKEFSQCPELSRLKNVGQNCGDDYLNEKIYPFSFNYSRYNHSVGVALIIWHFTKNIKMAVAGLFHDIATPTFAHVIDFLNNDAKTQTSTEKLTESIIKDSQSIQTLLRKYGLKTEEVSNYAMYPIADNKSPMLSADRLEYSIYMGVSRGIITIEEADIIYNNIIIAKNEYDVDEMCFKSREIARKFACLSLDNGYFMCNGVSTISNQLFADILRLAIERNIIADTEFMHSTEDEIIKKIECSKEDKMKKLWKIYQEFDSVTSAKKSITGKNTYSVCVNVKHRYIDPLCLNNGNVNRISKIDVNLNKQIKDFKQSNSRIYYSIHLDGV